MKKYIEFILENLVSSGKTTKFVTVDYKIIVKDLKDNPTTLITDFKIVKHENGKLEIKAKGYINTILNDTEYKKRKGWIAFDDFADDKTRTVWNKNVQNGKKRIKVYNK